MKHYVLTISLILSGLHTQAQFANCSPGSSQALLDINNVEALVHNGGDMWWDLTSGMARYTVPKNAGTTIFHASALWIGGMDLGGGLQLAGQTYRMSGDDYFPGPILTNGTTTNGLCNSFDQHFIVTSQEIGAFLAASDTSLNIWNWPGRANPHTGIPDQDLAPFVDVNNDNIYDPEDGDYPLIKGNQAIWWVINDIGNVHTATGGSPMGLEIQVMAYAFQTNDNINNITFYDYTLIKKTPGTLADTYVGIYADFDVGNPQDDYMAAHSGHNMMIGYNGDAFDETSGGAIGYGANPPIAAVKMVKSVVDNSGNPAPMAAMAAMFNASNNLSLPQVATEYYNYLRGLWRDGTPITAGGSGYGGTTPQPIMYDMANGIPNWTECSAGNIPNDRRGVMSFGPFTMQSETPYTFTTAALYARDMSATPSCDSLQLIVDAANQVQDFIDSLPDCSAFNPGYSIQIDSADFNLDNGRIEVTFPPNSNPGIHWSTGDVGTNVISGLAPGTYTLVLSDNYNCYERIDVQVPFSTGLEERPLSDRISVFPNPTQGQVTLHQENPEGVEAELLDMTGRVLERAILPPQEVTSLDYSNQPQGMYFLRIHNETQAFSLRLLITR